MSVGVPSTAVARERHGPAGATRLAPRRWLRAVHSALGHRMFLVLLVTALTIRIGAMALEFPAVMDSQDSPRFARTGPVGLFSDYWMPAGYAAFLKVLHHVSDQVWFSIAVQHLLGLVVGILVFLTARRLTAPPWLATVAAAPVLLSGDVVFLEHILMADWAMLAWTVAAIAAVACGLYPHADRRWLAVGGACGAAAALCRSPGLVVIVVLVTSALLAAGPGLRRRLANAASVLAGAAAILGAYVACFWAVGGSYLGLSDMTGWNLYTRVAPFADCSKFTPPRGTNVLCETTPPSQRAGVFYYSWDANSPSRRYFQPQDPTTAGPLGRFARTVILHQPGDYLVAVGTDLLRYLEPSAGSQRGYSGQGRDLVSFGFRDPPTEQRVTAALDKRYDGVRVHDHGTHTLAVYQNLVRVDRLLLCLALFSMVAGLVLARGPLRLGAGLFGGCAIGLYVLPTLTISYDFRYGIPPGVLLAVAGLLGAAGVVRARRGTALSTESSAAAQ